VLGPTEGLLEGIELENSEGLGLGDTLYDGIHEGTVDG